MNINPCAMPELADPINMRVSVYGKPNNLEGPSISNEIEVSTKQIRMKSLLGSDFIMYVTKNDPII